MIDVGNIFPADALNMPAPLCLTESEGHEEDRLRWEVASATTFPCSLDRCPGNGISAAIEDRGMPCGADLAFEDDLPDVEPVAQEI
jgi:hypothetical protein